MTPDSKPPDARHEAARRSTWTSVLVNLLLSAAQLLVGLAAQSQALVADALHSLSDLLSDGVVLVANRHSAKAPDAEHPYGHLRFETAATLAIGALLMIVGAGMLWRCLEFLLQPGSIPPVHPAALAMALLALAVKELLFRYLLRTARRVRSTLLAANAWHARSDAASSLVVAVGVGASLAGLPIADPLAALVVGLMVLRMGWKFAHQAFNDLVDHAADAQTEQAIRERIRATPGVLGLHDLRTRKMGDMIWVEVHLELDGSLTIEAGHAIADEARRRVLADLPVLNVITHFDPVRRPDVPAGDGDRVRPT